LRVDVDLAARERLVDHLGAPDVVLELHRKALGLECLLVDLAEDELLGEVLRAELHRRLPLARLSRYGGRRARLLLVAARCHPDREHEYEHGDERHAPMGCPYQGSSPHVVSTVSTTGPMPGAPPRTPRGVTIRWRSAKPP